MAKEEKKEEVKVSNGTAAKIKGLEERLAKVEAKMEKNKANWIRHIQATADATNTEGTVGSVRLASLFGVALASLCILCGSAFAATTVLENLPGPEGGTLKVQDVSGVASVEATGGESDDARLILDADQGDDTADTWTIESEASGNDLSILNGTTEVFNLDSSGNLSVDGTVTGGGAGGVTLENGASINNDTIGDVNVVFTNETAALGTLAVKSSAASNNIADNDIIEITFESVDSLAVAHDYGTIECKLTDVTTASVDSQIILKTFDDDASSTVLTIGSDAAGAEACTIKPNVTITGDLDIDGNDITSAGDLTITPAGGDIVLAGTTDTDALTVNAAAGVDVKSGGALVFGAATATSVNMHKSGSMTTILGTLNCDEAVTLDSTLVGAAKITANAELEANSLVDVNLQAATDYIRVTQTNTVGTSGQPLSSIVDARTGGNADQVTEASLVIDASGTYGLYVPNGKVAIVDNLEVTGNVTAGNLTTSTEAIDINSAAATDYIRFDQTNTVGTSSQPYAAITDARTGGNADSAAEASLVITASGTHGLSVAAGISALQAVTATTITGVGKLQITGEAEATSVDANLSAGTDYVRIDQTNTVGTSAQPLCSITDARTGGNADTYDEASLVITAAGAFGLSVPDGIVAIESVLDTAAAATMTIGASAATRVEIADTAVITDIEGRCEVASFGDNGLASALDATNNSTLTMEGLIVQMDANGGTNNATNAITLATIDEINADSVFYIVNTGSTNSLSIAQTGTFKSPALELAPYEAATVIAISSNAFYAVDSD